MDGDTPGGSGGRLNCRPSLLVHGPEEARELRMSAGLHISWIAGVLVCGALIIFVTLRKFGISQRNERVSHTAAEDWIRNQQQSIQQRIDALRTEMDSSKGTTDEILIKSQRARLDAIQNDLDEVKRSSGDAHSELDALKGASGQNK